MRDRPDDVRIIGLTGGIASGKSTVAAILRRLGATVIDADEVAREVVAPGQPALAEIVEFFGPEVLLSDGTLDRRLLGVRVFGDAAARARLNAITHPRIAAETARRIAACAAEGVPVVVYEATLIVENRVHEGLDGLIVVAVPREVQIARAVGRDGLVEAEVVQRLQAQAPLEEKLAVADYVIENAGPLADTERQVAAVWQDVLAGGPGRREPRVP